MLRTIIQIGAIVSSAALPAQVESESLGQRRVALTPAFVVVQEESRTRSKNIVEANSAPAL
jgi:hypothetical protein